MLKLIKAELYKSFNRAYLYILMGCAVLFLFGIIFSIRMTNSPVTIYYIMTILESMFILPVFLVLAPTSTATNEEIKEKTLRNTLSFGIPRNRLYIAKFIVSVILSAILGIVMLGAFFGFSFLMLSPGEQFTAYFINDFFKRLLSAVPLYTASIAICSFLGFVIKNEIVYSFTYAGLFIIVKPIIALLSSVLSEKLSFLDGFLISSMLSDLGANMVSDMQLLTIALRGALYTVIFVIIGMIVFKRQEIK